MGTWTGACVQRVCARARAHGSYVCAYERTSVKALLLSRC